MREMATACRAAALHASISSDNAQEVLKALQLALAEAQDLAVQARANYNWAEVIAGSAEQAADAAEWTSASEPAVADDDPEQ